MKREERSLDVSNGSQTTCPNVELLRGRDGRDGEPGRDGRDGMPGAQGPLGLKGEPWSSRWTSRTSRPARS